MEGTATGTNRTLKHCVLGVLITFVFGAAYIFEMRLNILYKEVLKREEQRNRDSETKVDQLEKMQNEIAHMKKLMEEVQKREEELSLMKQRNKDLETKVDQLEKRTTDSIQKEISHVKISMEEEQKRRTEIDSMQTTGSVYIRWGRTDCPESSSLVYKGYAGGSHYSHKGAASNFICLPEDPQWGDRQPTVNLAYVYGTEYESNLFGANVHQQDVPCSVCQARTGRSSIMIPARTSCYGDWTLQYKGYLGAGYHNHAAATEYICVDENVQTVPGGFENKDGKLIYPVVSKCGSLRCNPYIDNKPLICVVCSR